jgi:hypothetical protein
LGPSDVKVAGLLPVGAVCAAPIVTTCYSSGVGIQLEMSDDKRLIPPGSLHPLHCCFVRIAGFCRFIFERPSDVKVAGFLREVTGTRNFVVLASS